MYDGFTLSKIWLEEEEGELADKKTAYLIFEQAFSFNQIGHRSRFTHKTSDYQKTLTTPY